MSRSSIRSNRYCYPLRIALSTVLAAASAALVLASGALALERPAPVSPGAAAGAIAEARCPTFLWSGVPRARGYEVAVYRLGGEGEEPKLVTRASLPGDARGWTPPVGDCLERGGRYAWSVAVTGAGELAWSAPYLFEVEAAPSVEEVERAIATLQRFRDHAAVGEARERETIAGASDHFDEGAIRESPRRARTDRTVVARDGIARGGLDRSSVPDRVSSALAAPSIGDASLTVSGQVHLASGSAVFKNGALFLWSDSFSGNTALGRRALEDNTTGDGNTALGELTLIHNTTGMHNTAVGRQALYLNTEGVWNTAVGSGALVSNTTGGNNTASGVQAMLNNTVGSSNTAVGQQSLRSNTEGVDNTSLGSSAMFLNLSGDRNTGIGSQALFSNTSSNNTATGFSALFYNTSGSYNTATGVHALRATTTGSFNAALGHRALFDNVTGANNTGVGAYSLRDNENGFRNVALGYKSGVVTDGDDNVLIQSQGASGESNVLRIGKGTGDGDYELERAFVHGINDEVAISGTDAVAVMIDSNHELHVTTSTRRVKQDIDDLGSIADRLLELRPVSFRYRSQAAANPEAPVEFGLVAEEVAEVFPELVVYDRDGAPMTVKYHLLSTLLLEELQGQHAEIERQSAVAEEQASALRRQRELTEKQVGELERLRARVDALENGPKS